ncbi:hypothetical protein MUK42_16321 [Musa troglodytarum]|uniref:Uncharacterized protein n=1 Tax=Musa troglodytarum TaxID=320322 RepID=A0A9E7GZS3_9LILI|nr:hypothetical protein MUK42_16321 [Musa troglodytarum]
MGFDASQNELSSSLNNALAPHLTKSTSMRGDKARELDSGAVGTSLNLGYQDGRHCVKATSQCPLHSHFVGSCGQKLEFQALHSPSKIQSSFFPGGSLLWSNSKLSPHSFLLCFGLCDPVSVSYGLHFYFLHTILWELSSESRFKLTRQRWRC